MNLMPYLKAVGAFLASVATNAAVQIQEGHWPTSWADALRWLVSIVVTTWLVYQLPYKPAAPKAAPAGVFPSSSPTSAPPDGKHEK